MKGGRRRHPAHAALVPMLCGLLLVCFQNQPVRAQQNRVVLQQTGQYLRVTIDEQPFLTYNIAEVIAPPGMDPILNRSGYIHPFHAPSGRVVSGDFSHDHPHQRGLFGAWVKTRFRGQQVDFWNLHRGLGFVRHAKVESTQQDENGIVLVLNLEHVAKHEPGMEVVALHETWTVHVPAEQSSMYYFDVHVRQTCATEDPLHLPPHLYGGMALRGSNQWVQDTSRRAHQQWEREVADDPELPPPGMDQIGFEFLTSEGLQRHDGNHAGARWVAIHGPVDGQFAGAALLSHPDNFRAPQPVRLHPYMPYFCFTPIAKQEHVIRPDTGYDAKYRYVAFDGPADRAALERLWQQFSGK